VRVDQPRLSRGLPRRRREEPADDEAHLRLTHAANLASDLLSRIAQQDAYDRPSSVGKLDKALDEASAKGWTVVDTRKDWKRIYPFDK
jgi:hypothetical protein